MGALVKDPWFWVVLLLTAINLEQHRHFRTYRKIIEEYKQLLDKSISDNKGLLTMNQELLDAPHKSE